MNRPLPQPTPETANFWDGTRHSELRLQRCRACYHVYFPPRPFCPACSARDPLVFQASGRAVLHSFTISHLPAQGFTPPYVIAVVELEEGPKMMTNIVGCEPSPDALSLDMPLKVVFEKINEEITLPVFAPEGVTLR